jgi:hypothetical protein
VHANSPHLSAKKFYAHLFVLYQFSVGQNMPRMARAFNYGFKFQQLTKVRIVTMALNFSN